VSDQRHRAKQLRVWVTAAEWEALEHRAREGGLVLAEYVRRELQLTSEDGRHLRRQRREEET
jgi:hypothetical protein